MVLNLAYARFEDNVAPIVYTMGATRILLMFNEVKCDERRT